MKCLPETVLISIGITINHGVGWVLYIHRLNAAFVMLSSEEDRGSFILPKAWLLLKFIYLEEGPLKMVRWFEAML